jgi:hypothetical protein
MRRRSHRSTRFLIVFDYFGGRDRTADREFEVVPSDAAWLGAVPVFGLRRPQLIGSFLDVMPTMTCQRAERRPGRNGAGRAIGPAQRCRSRRMRRRNYGHLDVCTGRRVIAATAVQVSAAILIVARASISEVGAQPCEPQQRVACWLIATPPEPTMRVTCMLNVATDSLSCL